MAKEALEKVKDLTKEEIRDKIRSGEVEPPRKGPERDEFFKFIDMDKETRDKYLTGEPSQTPPPPPPKEVVKEEKVDPPKEKKPWYLEMGYENDEKAHEAHKNLLDLTSRLQSTVDKLNAKEGKSGNEIKRLTAERERLSKELDEIKKSSAPKIEKPQKPVRPKPADYENGMLDEKYVEAKEKYDTDMEDYLEKNAEFIRETTKREILESLPKPVVVEKEASDEPWDRFFNTDIPEFQKKFSLQTTVPVRQISDAYGVIAPESKSTAQEKATVSAFLKSLPENDLNNYNKVREAVTAVYTFDSGVPVKPYRTIEGGLFDLGLIGEGKSFNTVKSVQLSAEAERAARELAKQKNDQTVQAIASAEMGGQDPKLSQATTIEEKRKRYRDLLTMYNNAMNLGADAKSQFEKSPEWQEYLGLRKEILGKVPDYLR